MLIKEIAGGKITSDVMDIYPKKIQDHQVFLNFDNASSLIGEEIPKEIIKEILTSLDIKINNVTEAGLGMTIPAYRNDVTREADVIEEILRVYGYNNIKFTEKLNASISANQLIEDYQIQNKIGNQLTALGFYEMMGNSLTSPKYVDLSKALRHENNIEMLNPLSNDLSVMRQSMLFNALEALSFNSNRKISDLKLFEFGKTYHQYDTGRQEPKHLSLLVSGLKGDKNWILPSSKSTFFYFKGFVINVLDRLGITDYSENGTKDENFSEGLSFSKNDKLLVEFGTINKSITAAFGIDAETFYADFKWDEVLEEIATDNFKLKAISKFPKVKRDLALLIDESITFDSLKKTAQKTEKKLLKNINLFDVYTGSKLPEGKKSYALSFTIQDEKRTLTDKQIDKIMKKLQQNFESEFGASLR